MLYSVSDIISQFRQQQVTINESDMDISQNSPENVLNDDMVVDEDNDETGDYSF